MPRHQEKPAERSTRASAWVDEEIIRMAKTIAAEEDSSISEVIEEASREPIRRRYQRVIAKLSSELGEAGA